MSTKYALSVGLTLLAAAASAEPFYIDVKKPTQDGMQAAIDACPRGYGKREQSCQIRLPSGTIRGHWKVGGDDTAGVQVAFCLTGQGSGHGSTWPEGAPGAGGTTLVYDGPPGGTLLDVEGADFFCLRDVSIAMDGAAVGIRLSANNAHAATTQYPMLERLAIRGNMKKPAGIGLQITGAAKNDQVDALLADSLGIYDVDVGVEVDSDQAVSNRIGPGTKLSGQSAAVRVRRGSLSLDGVMAQCLTPNCCTYDLLPGHGYFRVRDGYNEIGFPPATNARLLCLQGGANAQNGSWHAVSIAESYINVQCDASEGPCSVDLLNGTSNVGVTFRDNWILSTNPPSQVGRIFARVLLSGPYGSPRLVWAGNIVHPSIGGIKAQIDPRVAVEAFTADAKGRAWNDTNLDGRWEESEPRMATGP